MRNEGKKRARTRDVFQKKKNAMSLHLEDVPVIPEETARVAHHWYPKTHRSRLLGDAWGAQ